MSDFTENIELPNNWALCTFSDVSEGDNAIVDGPFGSNLKTSDYIDDPLNGVPVLTTKNLEGDYSDKTVRFISKAKFEELKRSQVKPGDVLVAKIGSIGKTGIYPKNARTGIIPANLLKFTVSKEVEFDYVYSYLNFIGLQNKIKAIATATAQPAFNVTKFRLLELPLPPHPEQQRIVTKIEELFSSLDKGIESLKTAQQQLKVYRQAVLKWAFEGRLTNEKVRGGLPEGWKRVRLSAVCNKIQDGSHFSPKKQYDEPGENRFLYITAKNIRNNYIDFSKMTYVDREFHEPIYKRCNPEYGDVLLTKDGVNTGEVTLNSLKEEFSLLSSVCIFKTNSDELDSGFLKYFIQSPLGSRAVWDSMTGTAIKRIILRKIKDAEIIQPPLPEQHAIVAEIESRLSVCDKIEEIIEQSLQQSEALRQSILKKAFEGKLVPQDPNDEPASVLLERIRAEREQTKVDKKPCQSPFPLSPGGRGRG